MIDCIFLGQEINLNAENINIEDLIITQAAKGFYYGCCIQIFNIQNELDNCKDFNNSSTNNKSEISSNFHERVMIQHDIDEFYN